MFSRPDKPGGKRTCDRRSSLNYCHGIRRCSTIFSQHNTVRAMRAQRALARSARPLDVVLDGFARVVDPAVRPRLLGRLQRNEGTTMSHRGPIVLRRAIQFAACGAIPVGSSSPKAQTAPFRASENTYNYRQSRTLCLCSRRGLRRGRWRCRGRVGEVAARECLLWVQKRKSSKGAQRVRCASASRHFLRVYRRRGRRTRPIGRSSA
jgi:hypothetical protein